ERDTDTKIPADTKNGMMERTASTKINTRNIAGLLYTKLWCIRGMTTALMNAYGMTTALMSFKRTLETFRWRLQGPYASRLDTVCCGAHDVDRISLWLLD
ncbi:MAG: hypothetical protein AAFX99_10085, partial [Myxococcota bacterium]